MNEGERRARWLFLLAATGLAVYLTLRMLQPFLTVIIWAAVLVLLFYPLHRRFARRMSPGLAAGCSLVVVLVTVLVPIALVAAAVGAELAKVASDAPQRVERLLADPALGGRLQRLLARAQEWTGQDFAIAPDRVSELLANASETLLKGTFNVLGGVLGSVVKFFLVLFTTYFLFRDGAKVAAALPAALPMSRRGAERLIAHTGEIIHASVNGTLLIAAIQGALGGLMFWALGLPSPLVWGVVMTLLSLLPVGGSSVVWGPAALALGLTGHLGKAVVLALWGGLVMGTIDNVLRPKLVGERARMHELTIFFSVLGGIQLFGMLGFLVGPVLVALTRALLEAFLQGSAEEEGRQTSAPSPPDGPAARAATEPMAPPGAEA